jgi:putative component of membrane protein insertase Oxa1/YidC/SpoIIIJ protein YidD
VEPAHSILQTAIAFFAVFTVFCAIAAPATESERMVRRAALVDELIAEGAPDEARAEMARLLNEAPTPSTSNALARASARLSLEEGTLAGIARAFHESRDAETFRVAGCALYLALQDDAEARAANAALYEQARLCADSWKRPDWREARALLRRSAPQGGGGIGGFFASCVFRFYKFAVGPALGSRCALEPSCSRYFLDASRKHGLVGIPMITDRFVREPVASASDKLVRDGNGELKHPDPVSEHDWWFSED